MAVTVICALTFVTVTGTTTRGSDVLVAVSVAAGKEVDVEVSAAESVFVATVAAAGVSAAVGWVSAAGNMVAMTVVVTCVDNVVVESAEVAGEEALGILASPIGIEPSTVVELGVALDVVLSCETPMVTVVPAAAAVVGVLLPVSGVRVVYPPIDPEKVGLAVTKIIVTLAGWSVDVSVADVVSETVIVSDEEATVGAATVTSAVTTEVSWIVVWAWTVVVEAG